MTARTLPALLLALAVSLAACGGDDEEAGTAATPSATASAHGSDHDADTVAWAEEVNGICTDNKEEVEKIAAEVQAEGLPADETAAEVIERTGSSTAKLLERLRGAEAPADIQGDYDAFLDGIEQSVPLLDRLAGDLRDGKEDPALAAEFARIAAETRPFATEHELTACLPDRAG